MSILALALAASVPCPADGPVIDVHVHSYEHDPRFAARVPNPGTGEAMTVTDGATHAAATVAALRAAGVVRAIVGGESVATDDRMVALDPARLRAGFEVNDMPTPGDLAAIRVRHAAGKLAMIGEVAYQYYGVRHDDPGLEPLWVLAEELQVPILVHAGAGPPGVVYHGSPRHRAQVGDPLLFEPVLVRHPRLKLIIAHGGYPFRDSMLALLQAFPQVHVELAAIDWAEYQGGFEDYLRALVTYGFGKRILFGSDQMVWPDAIAQAIARHRAAAFLTSEQRHDIFYANAVRLFGWRDLPTCTPPRSG